MTPARIGSAHGSAPLVTVALALVASFGCGGTSDAAGSRAAREALLVIAPHPDDESILGAATIHRLASESARFVHAIYVSAGDKATTAGDCNGLPEAEKTERIITLREDETRAAWRKLAPERDVPIDFERGPDLGLVTSSRLVDGVRQDVLSAAGEAALAGAVEAASSLPADVREVWILTTSRYDGHPDHRTAYRAAAQTAARLRTERGAIVHLWSAIVHDEFFLTFIPSCCGGDFFWPNEGATLEYEALLDVPSRPRPPRWDRIEDASSPPDIRRDALGQHVSQVVGNSELCMPVYIPSFYARWMEKIEEPFYEEDG